jgi:hypothetical protein
MALSNDEGLRFPDRGKVFEEKMGRLFEEIG